MSSKKIIVFEGLDGVGKTKFSTILQNLLLKSNINVSLWSIDSHFNITEKEKNSPHLSFNYYIESLEKRLLSDNNKYIIFDRYIPSALGYKLLRDGNQKNANDILEELNKLYERLIKPDITFLLTTPHKRRKKNIFLKETIDNYDRNSLDYENIIFWNEYYKLISDESFFNITTNLSEESITNTLLNYIYLIVNDTRNL